MTGVDLFFYHLFPPTIDFLFSNPKKFSDLDAHKSFSQSHLDQWDILLLNPYSIHTQERSIFVP